MSKIKLLIIIFITISFRLDAQYIPMLKEGAEWYGYSSFEGGKTNSRYIVETDTIVYEKQYKRIATYRDSIFTGYSLMSEDSLAQKIYRCSLITNDSVICSIEFDFLLKKNDTFNWNGFDIPIDSISNMPPISVKEYLNVPKNTRFFYFHGGPIWVEGVGYLSTSILEGDPLTCHYNSDGKKDISYPYVVDSPIIDCKGDISMSSSNIGNSSLVFLLTPNPCQLNLHITLDESQGRKKIALFDLVGNKIADYSFVGLEYDIDIMYLPKGIYFIQIVLDGEFIGVKKFVKE